MKRTGARICPLSPAHLAGFGSIQISIILVFFDLKLALIPLALFILLCLVAPFFPQVSFFLPVINRGRTGMNAIALTFDDGPDPFVTPALLKILSDNSIKAAFFVTGRNAMAHPEIIREILSQGHSICNHSYSHDPFLMLKSSSALKKEIESAQTALKGFKIAPLAFRPPAGITNPRLRNILLDLGLYCVNFSCRPFDGGNRHVKGLAKRTLKKVRPDDIIVLHDVMPYGKSSLDLWLSEIESIISGLKKKGLGIIPLSDIIGREVMRSTG